MSARKQIDDIILKLEKQKNMLKQHKTFINEIKPISGKTRKARRDKKTKQTDLRWVEHNLEQLDLLLTDIKKIDQENIKQKTPDEITLHNIEFMLQDTSSNPMHIGGNLKRAAQDVLQQIEASSGQIKTAVKPTLIRLQDASKVFDKKTAELKNLEQQLKTKFNPATLQKYITTSTEVLKNADYIVKSNDADNANLSSDQCTSLEKYAKTINVLVDLLDTEGNIDNQIKKLSSEFDLAIKKVAEKVITVEEYELLEDQKSELDLLKIAKVVGADRLLDEFLLTGYTKQIDISKDKEAKLRLERFRICGITPPVRRYNFQEYSVLDNNSIGLKVAETTIIPTAVNQEKANYANALIGLIDPAIKLRNIISNSPLFIQASHGRELLNKEACVQATAKLINASGVVCDTANIDLNSLNSMLNTITGVNADPDGVTLLEDELKIQKKAWVKSSVEQTNTPNSSTRLVKLRKAEDSTDFAILVVNDNKITGMVMENGVQKFISPSDNDPTLHTLIQLSESGKLDLKNLDNRDDTEVIKLDPTSRLLKSEDIPKFQGKKTLKIKLAYSKHTASYVKDLKADALLQVATLNTVLANSGLDDIMAYELEGNPIIADYTGQGYSSVDALEFAKQKIDRGNADVLNFILDGGEVVGSCGRSALNCEAMTSLDSLHACLTSIVIYHCSMNRFTLSHENMHNFWAQHEPNAATSATPYPDAHGIADPTTHIGTIMSYDAKSRLGLISKEGRQVKIKDSTGKEISITLGNKKADNTAAIRESFLKVAAKLNYFKGEKPNPTREPTTSKPATPKPTTSTTESQNTPTKAPVIPSKQPTTSTTAQPTRDNIEWKEDTVDISNVQQQVKISRNGIAEAEIWLAFKNTEGNVIRVGFSKDRGIISPLSGNLSLSDNNIDQANENIKQSLKPGNPILKFISKKSNNGFSTSLVIIDANGKEFSILNINNISKNNPVIKLGSDEATTKFDPLATNSPTAPPIADFSTIRAAIRAWASDDFERKLTPKEIKTKNKTFIKQIEKLNKSVFANDDVPKDAGRYQKLYNAIDAADTNNKQSVDFLLKIIQHASRAKEAAESPGYQPAFKDKVIQVYKISKSAPENKQYAQLIIFLNENGILDKLTKDAKNNNFNPQQATEALFNILFLANQKIINDFNSDLGLSEYEDEPTMAPTKNIEPKTEPPAMISGASSRSNPVETVITVMDAAVTTVRTGLHYMFGYKKPDIAPEADTDTKKDHNKPS